MLPKKKECSVLEAHVDPIKDNWWPICTKIWALISHISFSEWIVRRLQLPCVYWKQAIHGGAAYVRRSVNADHRDVVVHGKIRWPKASTASPLALPRTPAWR